jgi:hypothetical protein
LGKFSPFRQFFLCFYLTKDGLGYIYGHFGRLF